MRLKEILEHLIELSQKGLARSVAFTSAQDTYNHRFIHASDMEKEEALRFVEEIQKTSGRVLIGQLHIPTINQLLEE